MPNDTSQLDPSIINLMHGLKMQEGGGKIDYNAVGDDGTASGAGQWSNQPNGTPTKLSKGQIPYNFQEDAKQYGLDPTDFSPDNQNKVMYARLADRKAKGYTPEQILSEWNSGDKNKYLNSATSTGTGPVGNYDVSTYVKNAMKYAQEYKGQSSPQNNGLGALTPTAEASTQSSDSQNIPQPNSQPESLTQKAGDVLKGIGNFLFPIVSDVGNDITGKSNKTLLQQGGDLALSALPFIPGLGEAGEAARGAEVAADVAPEVPGLLSKLAGNTIAKGAGVGYGAGVASNLSQGQGLGQSFLPNINTIGGAVLGGAAPAVMKGASGLIDKFAGIDPQIANELGHLGSQGNPEDVKLYDQYIKATKEHASNLRATPPLTMAANNLDTAASTIDKHLEEAGKVVGATKKAVADMPLPQQKVAQVGTTFAQQVKDNFGLDLISDEKGNVKAIPVSGSMRQVAPSEVSRIENMATQLNKLYAEGENGGIGKTSDIISNLNELVDHTKDDAYGHTNDPLEGLIKNTAGNLNKSVREISPTMAGANDRYSQLKDLQREISSMAGKNLNKGELLMKRVFSGDKSGDVQDLFGKIKSETGIDLVKHAVLAKHAIESLGSRADKSLLEQAIEGAVSSHTGGLVSGVIGAGKSALRKTIANPERIGRKLISGKGASRIPGLITKAAIRTGVSIPSK